ncbi:MAG: MFS transporter, partial [Hoeflea sp.]|nr:MFS transporter [Hoeflea sp.]
SFISILLIGIANGAFGTLAPVFGANVGLTTLTIATMMSITIFSGAVMQLPAGRMSDRMDRRYVLAGLAAVAGLSGLAIAVIQPSGIGILFGLISLYGAMSYTLYSITVAHANDFAASDKFVTVSGGLLLLYGIGTIIGPLIGGFAMASNTYLLFAVTAVSHVAIAVYALFRTRRRAAIPAEDRDNFSSTPLAKSATPESINLDPRATTQDN